MPPRPISSSIRYPTKSVPVVVGSSVKSTVPSPARTLSFPPSVLHPAAETPCAAPKATCRRSAGPRRIDVDVGRVRELHLAATVGSDHVEIAVTGPVGGVDDRAPVR